MKNKKKNSETLPSWGTAVMANFAPDGTFAPVRRDDLPTVEQNARLFRSLDRLQRKAQGRKVWR